MEQKGNNAVKKDARTALKGGMCRRHGAKSLCSIEGCTNIVIKGGVCTRHGKSRAKKQCSSEGCKNHAQRGGVCCRHGSKSKLCGTEGCTNKLIKEECVPDMEQKLRSNYAATKDVSMDNVLLMYSCPNNGERPIICRM